MITKLTTDAEIDEACSQLRKVFHTVHNFRLPFMPHVTHRAVLFPAHYLLYEEQVNALVAASNAIGEHEAYYSAVLGAYSGWEHFSSYREWQARLEFRPGINEALHANASSGFDANHAVVYLESALYSTQGTWAAMSYYQEYGVAGGTSEFMSVLASRLDLDTMAVGFLQYLMRDFKADAENRQAAVRLNGWYLVNLYEHIYGAKTADRYLNESGLLRFLYEIDAAR